MRKTAIWFFLAVCYTLAVSIVSLVNFSDVKSLDIKHSDKIIHAGIYFVFTILWCFYFCLKSTKNKWFKDAIVKSIVLAFSFGILIELLQEVSNNGRSGDLYDVLANSAGILVAFLILKKLIVALKLKN